MQKHEEEWKELCRQASVEQDPQRMLELTKKINELLAGKRHRLEGQQRESPETNE